MHPFLEVSPISISNEIFTFDADNLQSELSKIGIGGKARLYWGGTLLVQSITTDQSELQNNQETE